MGSGRKDTRCSTVDLSHSAVSKASVFTLNETLNSLKATAKHPLSSWQFLDELPREIGTNGEKLTSFLSFSQDWREKEKAHQFQILSSKTRARGKGENAWDVNVVNSRT